MKRAFPRIDNATNRTIHLAAIIGVGLICHFTGGLAAAIGAPVMAICALVLLFWRGAPLLFAGKSPSGAKTGHSAELLPRLRVQREVDESVGEVQISALGSPFKKERWDETEAAVDAIVDSCIDLVRGKTRAFTVAVFFPAAAGEGFAIRRFKSGGEYVDRGAVLQPGLGVLGGFFKHGLKTLNLQEIVSDSTTLYYYTRDQGIRSLIACPILAGNAERGVVIADSTEKGAFTDEHLSFVSAVAGLLGQAAYHAYLRTEHALQHLRLAAVSTIEKELFKRHSIDEILDIVAEVIPFAFPCDRMTISVRSGEGETATIRRVYGQYTETLPDREFSLTEKTLASVVYAKNICFSRNFAADRYEVRYLDKEPRGDGFASFLAVPLGVDDCKGMILIESSKPDAFPEQFRALLSRIATSAGLAIEKIRIIEKANAMATHDGLTGLFNHRQFQLMLKDEITRSIRYDDPLSLVLCDIDFFKKTNDTYGHPFGDAVLKNAAKLLESSIRDGIDTAARYGGEEFALILVKTDEQQAVETAERIRETIARNLPGSPSGNDTRVTMSFGIAVFGKHAKELDELIKKADKALYRAKEQGRNRVEVF